MGVYTLARSVEMYNSLFLCTPLNVDNKYDVIIRYSPPETVNITITGSNFNGSSSITCDSQLSYYQNGHFSIRIGLSAFKNNPNSALVLQDCPLSLLDNVTFYNSTILI